MDQFKKPLNEALAKAKPYIEKGKTEALTKAKPFIEKGKVYAQQGKLYAQQHKRNTIIGALLALLIIWWLWPTGSHVPAQAPIPVVTATAVQKNMRVDLYASGTVVADMATTVRSRVDGHVVSVGFVAGESVKTGDLLVILDTRPFEIALEQARATLARDQATLTFKQENLKRYANLIKQKYVSQSEFELAQSDEQAAAANVQASQAAVHNAELQLEYCYIRAPIDGRTGDVLIKIGNLVRGNDTSIVVINQIAPIHVQFALAEQYWQPTQVNFQQGNVAVEARSPQDNSLLDTGKLTFLDNSINSTTGTFSLKAEFANKKQQLWPGQYVKIYIPHETLTDAIVIPASAIQESNQGPFVFVITPENKAVLRPVKLGATVNNETIIFEGVAAGETVVTEGQFRLTNDSNVTLKSDDTANQSADH